MSTFAPRPPTGCLLLIAGSLLATPPPSPAALGSARTAVLVALGPALERACRQALADPAALDLDLELAVAATPRQAAEWRAAVAQLPAQGWALVAPGGALLGQGTAAPAAAELARLLSAAGVRPPIERLRAFLATHPAHQEARADLIRLLHRRAAARTCASLDLPAAAPGAGRIPDLRPYQGRCLAVLEDLEAWGPWAQEVDRMFQDGGWPALALAADPPVEACSPTAQALYARNLPKVEAALAALPGAEDLWTLWLRMAAVAGGRQPAAWVRSLPAPPDESHLPWPPAGLSLAQAWAAGAAVTGRDPGTPAEPALLGFQRVRTPAAPRPASIGQLLRELAGGRETVLLVTDAERIPAQAEVAELLAEEPLAGLGLRAWVVDPATPAETRRGRYWHLLGPAGVAAEGAALPAAADLAKACALAGGRPRTAALETFLEAHPGRLDVLSALLKELARQGDMRTRKRLGNAQKPPAAERVQARVGGMLVDAGPDEPYTENQAPLDDGDDEAVWARYCGLLAARGGDLAPFADQVPYPFATLVPECLWASPRLQAVAASLLPKLEAALAARPRSAGLWQAWLALHGEDRPVADLLESLAPSPLGKGPWPPAGVRAEALRDLRRHGHWQELAALAEPVWRDLRDAAAAARNPDALAGGAWGDLCEPLLEALVRLHRLTDADALVKDWVSLSAWRSALTRAQQVALDCGEEPLMHRWAELSETP